MNVPYQPFQAQNNEAAGGTRSADASAESFGGAGARDEMSVGQGLKDVGDAGFNIALNEQRQVNNDKVRVALSDYRDKMDQKVAGDFLQRKGADGINIVPEAKAFHDSLRDETAGALDNDYQKRVFMEMEGRHRESSMRSITMHEAQQRDVFHKQSLLADNATSLKDAVLNSDDPKALAQNEFAIRQNTLHLHDDNPMASILADAQVSNMYETIAKTKAQNLSAVQGLAFMEKYKDKMDEVTRSALQEKFENKAIGEAANVKAQIIASMPGINAVSAQKLIDEQISNPKEAELTMANVKSRLAVNEKAAKDEQQKQVETSWKNFMANTNSDIDPNLPHEEQMKMAEYREKAAKEKTVDEQKEAYGKLLNMASTNPTEFMKENLYPHVAELGSHFNFISELQTKMRGGDEKETENFKAGMKMAEQAMKGSSYFKTSWASGFTDASRKLGLERQNAFIADVQSKIQALPDNERKDYKKVQAIVDEEVKDRVLNNTDHDWIPFNDKSIKQFELNQGQLKPGDKVTDQNQENLRADGTPKANGYFGQLQRPDGKVSTELSVGVEFDGKNMEIPSLVPTLNEKEKQYLINGGDARQNPDIMRKAVEHAKMRIAQGKSPFASNSESPQSSSPSAGGQLKTPGAQSKAGPSNSLINFVKEQEGFAGKAYADSGQTSVGYGTRAKSADEVLTEPQAESRLREELAMHHSNITQAAQEKGLSLNENQIQALTSFDYNTGKGVNLIKTSNNMGEILQRMQKYTSIKGKLSQGLVNRRKAEMKLALQ